MANLNKVMLIGNVTRDIELKFTGKGLAVADLGMAINRKYKTESGDLKEEVTFVDVTLFGRQAEIAKEYLGKGKPVYIEGRLQLDSWDDKATGQKRTKLKVTGEALQLLGSRGDNVDGSGGGGSSSRRSESSASASDEDEYDQRPAPRQQTPAASSSGGGGASQQRPKPRPAPAPVQDEDDDIPF